MNRLVLAALPAFEANAKTHRNLPQRRAFHKEPACPATAKPKPLAPLMPVLRSRSASLVK